METILKASEATGLAANHRGSARLDAEPGSHPLVEGGEGRERAHEDGQLSNAAVLVELEEVDAFELAVADVGAEAEDDGALVGQLVDIGEAFERGDHMSEDRRYRLASLEAAKKDRAVQDDVLAQGLGEEVDVLCFGGAAKWVRLGHGEYSTSVPSDRFYSRLSHSLGATGLRVVGKLNVPLYRLTRGRIGGKVGKGPVLLLTTTGRKSGEPRTAPVLYLADGDSFVIINTNAGNAKVPAWSLNLRANPEAEVEVKGKRVRVRARLAEGEERDDLWRRHNEQYSGWDYYESKLDREISVLVLEPR